MQQHTSHRTLSLHWYHTSSATVPTTSFGSPVSSPGYGQTSFDQKAQSPTSAYTTPAQSGQYGSPPPPGPAQQWYQTRSTRQSSTGPVGLRFSTPFPSPGQTGYAPPPPPQAPPPGQSGHPPAPPQPSPPGQSSYPPAPPQAPIQQSSATTSPERSPSCDSASI